MPTTSGPPIGLAGQPQQHPRVFDGRSYWPAERALPKDVAQSMRLVGSGETAASVVISLLPKSYKRSTIDLDR